MERWWHSSFAGEYEDDAASSVACTTPESSSDEAAAAARFVRQPTGGTAALWDDRAAAVDYSLRSVGREAEGDICLDDLSIRTAPRAAPAPALQSPLAPCAADEGDGSGTCRDEARAQERLRRPRRLLAPADAMKRAAEELCAALAVFSQTIAAARTPQEQPHPQPHALLLVAAIAAAARADAEALYSHIPHAAELAHIDRARPQPPAREPHSEPHRVSRATAAAAAAAAYTTWLHGIAEDVALALGDDVAAAEVPLLDPGDSTKAAAAAPQRLVAATVPETRTARRRQPSEREVAPAAATAGQGFVTKG